VFICIGKRKGDHGRSVACTNTSDTPSIAAQAEWGWLCPQCLATQYGRPTFQHEIVDIDKPNTPELEAYEMEPGSRAGCEESEAEELAGLRDLELDIDGLF
jgi:hypothetical protein